MSFKLGKLPKKWNEKTLLLDDYLPDALPAAPPKIWREFKVPQGQWGMYGNNLAGCCTFSAKAHRRMMETAHTGTMVTPDPALVMDCYIALTGYDPATGANDTGCAMTDVLQYEQTTGIAGNKILAWAQIDHTNIDKIKQAMYIFGAVDIGVQFPANAMAQFNGGLAWTAEDDDGGIEGGHDVIVFGEGSVGASCVTWAMRQEFTWEWFSKYCDEAYAVISQNWINAITKLAPNSLDMAALQADLEAIKS
jgi:hypothetical protein